MKKRKVDDSPSSLNEGDVFRGETYRYRISPEEVKDRAIAMKDYLKSIAETPPAESVPQPHLERHQAWILLRGNTKHYRKYETYTLGADTFSYFIYPMFCGRSTIFLRRDSRSPRDLLPFLPNLRFFLNTTCPSISAIMARTLLACSHTKRWRNHYGFGKMFLWKGNRNRFGGRAPNQYSIRDSLANANRGARPKKRDHPKTAGEGK